MKKMVLFISFLGFLCVATPAMCGDKVMAGEIEQWKKDSLLKREVLKKYCPKQFAAFVNFIKSIKKDTVLDARTMELIEVAIAIKAQSIPCIIYHTKAALEAGATKEELYSIVGSVKEDNKFNAEGNIVELINIKGDSKVASNTKVVAENKELINNDGVVSSESNVNVCLLYTSPSPRDLSTSRMPSSA